MANLVVILNILKVALGLGFVIFLHELGHFLLAKWNGVKVEKFSIGFGPTLVGFRRGETEYVIAAIPLGGFVKMLGEGPEEEASKSTDPRAFPNKSVGARMAIISAGVIMNVLLGMACFVYAYGRGMDEIPAKIGAVKPGSPAYEAGLRQGDEIVAIDGRTDINFISMTLKISLSGTGQRVNFQIRRPGHSELIPISIEPRREETEDVPRIGVGHPSSLELAETPFLYVPGLGLDAKKQPVAPKTGDRLKEMGLSATQVEPVRDAEDVSQRLMRDRKDDVHLVFERAPKEGDEKGQAPSKVVQTLPRNHVLGFGFRLTAEPISSLRADSPATAAEFRLGDRIVAVDGDRDFDPMRLPEIVFDHAGSPIKFDVERPVAGQAQPKLLTLEATPDSTPPSLEFFPGAPLDIPGLGLSYPIRTRIAAVNSGSPAERAGLKEGDVINKMTLTFPKDTKRPNPVTYTFGEKNSEWLTAFSTLQLEPVEMAELTINGSSKAVRIKPEPEKDWYNPSRGLIFEYLIRRLPPQSAESAMRRGFDDTIDNILRIYAMLRSLAQKRVSPKLLGGPIMIANVAYRQADTGLTALVHFLGILSINLAVLNFLPIPPLDGGQMVFLMAEKVRGRPLPDSAVIVGSWIGIVMLACLMLYVMFQDIVRLVTN